MGSGSSTQRYPGRAERLRRRIDRRSRQFPGSGAIDRRCSWYRPGMDELETDRARLRSGRPHGPVGSAMMTTEAGSDVELVADGGATIDGTLDDRLRHAHLRAELFGVATPVTIGRFTVVRRIGRGGMGTVYVATDPELDRKIALKVLRSDRPAGRARMLLEARALARLSHPNVVAIHEVGTDGAHVYLAMELVEGQTLRAWLERAPSRGDVLRVLSQVARGLQAAHRAGLVHRDVKPDNVIVGADGRVRVVDFGVAKADDESPVANEPAAPVTVTLTSPGHLLGTPAYMAAEQFLGLQVDARTDVFGFCVVLCEALSGKRPFAGDDAATIAAAVLRDAPEPLPSLPAPLADLVRRGLARDRERRPSGLQPFVDALTAAGAPPRRRAALAFAVAMGLGAAAIGGARSMADDGPSSAEIEAWAAVEAAGDDATRLAAAEAFLAEFEDTASAQRRAIAHATAGDVLWRRSCDAAADGLCLRERPNDVPACGPTPRGPFERLPRDAAAADVARGHLRAAIELAGVAPSGDSDEDLAFGRALARARIQRADDELETFASSEAPPELDFVHVQSLSEAAFREYFERLSQGGTRVIPMYAAVKAHGDVTADLVAAARTGLATEIVYGSLARAEGGLAEPRQRAGNCEGMRVYLDPLREQMTAAYQWCVTRAQAHGLGSTDEARACQARLAVLAEIDQADRGGKTK
ncbi:MAG: serine/threonine protein kinase [Nannocystaceae bacterium]|nr:serine/threonine protein kinase [Nannocystaceae bacterium]